jgi:competence protein ComEC
LASGQLLTETGAATVRVLHPPAEGCDDGDNADSIVLRVDCWGRSILLPGDLEQAGLRRVLAAPCAACDVLLVPHHGSIRSSPAELAAWCRPAWAIVSAAADEAGGPAEAIYAARGATVLHTGASGAVRAEIRPQTLTVRAWAEEPW